MFNVAVCTSAPTAAPKPDTAAVPAAAAGGSGKYIIPSHRGEGKKAGDSMAQSRLNGKYYRTSTAHIRF